MKNLEWVFKLTDQVSPAAKDIATNLNGVKKVLDTISSSTALPGLEKTAKALGGMARGFALLNDADKVVPQMQAIGNALPDLAIAADLTSKEIGALGKAFAQMSSGDKLVKVNQELPILARNLNSFRINTNAITGVSMLSKSMGALATATNRMNPDKMLDSGIAIQAIVPSLNKVRINPNTITGVSMLAGNLAKVGTAMQKIAPHIAGVASGFAALNGVNLSGFVAELKALESQLQSMLENLKNFKSYMVTLGNALDKIGASNIANLKDININVRQSGGGGGGGGGGNGGPVQRGRRRNSMIGGDLRFGNLVGFPAGALSSIGGALGNKAFSGLSLAGRFMSSSGLLIGSLSALTAAVISLKNTFLGIAEQERNIMKMGTLFGEDRAKAAMTYAVNFAAQTPFELSGVISAISKLRGSAQLTEKQITPIMQSMADLGAATGMTSERMSGAMEQLVQMIGLGVAHLEELNIIAENGIPIFQAISQETGFTMAQIREMTSKNKLSAITVANALVRFSQKEYFGAAAKGAQTLSGMLDQLASRATYFNLLMAMGPMEGEPDVLKNFKVFLKNMVNLTDPRKEPGITIFKNIQNIVKTVDEILFGGLAKISDPALATDAIIKFLGDLNYELKQLKPLIGDVKDVFTELYKIIKETEPYVWMIKEALLSLYYAWIDLSPETKKTISQLIAFGIAATFAFNAISRIYGIGKSIWEAMKLAKTGLDMFLKKLKGSPAQVGKVVQTIGNVFRTLGPILMRIPVIGWVIMAGAAIGWLVATIIKNWDSVKYYLSDLWDNIVWGFQDFIDSVKNFFTVQAPSIGQSIVLGIANGIAHMLPTLGPLMQKAIDMMQDAWGINSPSKVAMWMGENVGLGFNRGLESTYALPAGITPIAAGVPSYAYTPATFTPYQPSITAPQSQMATTPSAMPPVSVNINVNGSKDPRATAEEVRKIAVSAVLEALETAAGEAGIWQ